MARFGSFLRACLVGAALGAPGPAAAQPGPAAPSSPPTASPTEPAPADPQPAAQPTGAAAPVEAPATPAEAPAAPAEAPAAPAEPPAPPPPPSFAPPPGQPPPTPVAAEGRPPTTPGEWSAEDLGQRRHDGFMIRLAIGFGYSTSESDRLRYQGFGGPYSIALGYSVIENLQLVVDFFGSGMLGADISIDGADARDSSIDARTSGIGLGATYYLMPINLFVAASVGVGWHAFDAPRGGAQVSHAGIALNALLGKEFWVGEQWGIGAAFQFVLVQCGDDYDGSLLGMGFGGLFSATYN